MPAAEVFPRSTPAISVSTTCSSKGMHCSEGGVGAGVGSGVTPPQKSLQAPQLGHVSQKLGARSTKHSHDVGRVSHTLVASRDEALRPCLRRPETATKMHME